MGIDGRDRICSRWSWADGQVADEINWTGPVTLSYVRSDVDAACWLACLLWLLAVCRSRIHCHCHALDGLIQIQRRRVTQVPSSPVLARRQFGLVGAGRHSQQGHRTVGQVQRLGGRPTCRVKYQPAERSNEHTGWRWWCSSRRWWCRYRPVPEMKLKVREGCNLQPRGTDLDWLGGPTPPVLAWSRWAVSHSPEYRVC